MYKILSRKQFRDHWEQVVGSAYADLVNDGGPLWIPEEADNLKSNWFVAIRPITVQDNEHHNWVRKNCQGAVKCYSSGEDEEWWGFTYRDDVDWWLLRWG